MGMNEYAKLSMVSGISLAIMYAVMFLNISEPGHAYLSLNRLYLSLLMVTPMVPLMIASMRKMYPSTRLNAIMVAGSAVLFVLALALLRAQAPIGDEQYMRAMIPHHSSAIMTSENADIQDPEVRALADSIIESQEREIAQMESIMARMGRS